MNEIIPLNNRVLIKVNTAYRDTYKLTDTIEIQMTRNVEQFDERMKNPVNATVISGRGLTAGQELLLSHVSIHETNRISDSGLDDIEQPHIKYYSVPETEVYAYRDAYNPDDVCSGWQPYGCVSYEPDANDYVLTNVLFVKKVFLPHPSTIIYMPPKELTDRLFVVRGNRHEGKVLITEQYCYYTIYFQEVTGKEANISRMKDTHWEVSGVAEDLTEQVLNGELLIGDTPEDAKTYAKFFKLQTV